MELALLKCHLLIEEVLTKIITRSAKHPEFILNAKLSFAQKASLARSLSDLEKETWAWGALRKLNDARNELAHGLAKPQIKAKLEEFITFVEAEQATPEKDVISPTFGRFQWAAFKLFAFFAAYAHFDPTTLKIPTLLSEFAEQAQTDEQ